MPLMLNCAYATIQARLATTESRAGGAPDVVATYLPGIVTQAEISVQGIPVMG